MNHSLADTYGVQVSEAVRAAPEQRAAVAWAATAAGEDRLTARELLTDEEITFAQSIQRR